VVNLKYLPTEVSGACTCNGVRNVLFRLQFDFRISFPFRWSVSNGAIGESSVHRDFV